MILSRRKMPKIDGLLSLTVVKIEKGKEYSQDYHWEDTNYPAENIGYMEWSEDWFDDATIKPKYEMGDMQSSELVVKAKRDGYLVANYSTISNHPNGILEEEINNLGVQEIVGNLAEEIGEIYEKSYGWDNVPEKEIVLVFGASLHTDWETGYTEAESAYLGYLDWMTGEIK